MHPTNIVVLGNGSGEATPSFPILRVVPRDFRSFIQCPLLCTNMIVRPIRGTVNCVDYPYTRTLSHNIGNLLYKARATSSHPEDICGSSFQALLGRRYAGLGFGA